MSLELQKQDVSSTAGSFQLPDLCSMLPLHPALLRGKGLQEFCGKEELRQRRRHTDEILVAPNRKCIAALAVSLPLLRRQGGDGLSPLLATVELVRAEFFLSRHPRTRHLSDLQRQFKGLVRRTDKADLGHFVWLRLRSKLEKAQLDPANPLHHLPALFAGLDRRLDLHPGRLGEYLVTAVMFEIIGHLVLLFRSAKFVPDLYRHQSADTIHKLPWRNYPERQPLF